MSKRLGHIAEAKIVASLPLNEYGNVEHGHLPKGWKKLGDGAYRSAYLSPSGVVYKRMHPWTSQKNNRDEYRRYLEHRNAVKGFRLARCRYFKSNMILAMEYVKDDRSDCWKSHDSMRNYMRNVCNYYDCTDTKRGKNWHGVNGIAIITDYEYGYD